MNKSRALVLGAEDWEMLYVNGELKEEHHALEEGRERVIWFLEKAKEYNFDLEDIEWKYLSEEDDKELSEIGSGHRYLSEYKEEY